jgi:DNA-binding GntR family transcriptional regulator
MRFRDHFVALIEAGSLAPGTRFPPERALAEEFSITRVTVRQALIRMEAEGVIFRENRRGWFVSPPRVRYDPTANTSFTESIAEQGRVAGTTVLSRQQVAASQWESSHLGCAAGDPIFVISRLRTVDGRAILVERIHVKAARCPGLLDYPLDQSLTDLMAEKFGIVAHRAQINMRPTALSEIPAKALGVAVGTPSLYLSRAILDQFDEVVEFDQEFWRHDAIDICVSAGRPEEKANKLRPTRRKYSNV